MIRRFARLLPAVPSIAMLCLGAGFENPYLFGVGAMFYVGLLIAAAADQLEKAIETSSAEAAREISLTIEQPFRHKLRDAVAAARIGQHHRTDRP